MLFTASVSRLLRCPTEVSVLKSLSTILTSPQNGVEIADANRTYTIVGDAEFGIKDFPICEPYDLRLGP